MTMLKDGIKTKTQRKIDNLWMARSMIYVAHICGKQALKTSDDKLMKLAEWFFNDAKVWKSQQN